MNRLARRMRTLAAVEISLVLVAVILIGALFAFGFYIRALNNELSGTVAQLDASLSGLSFANARAGGEFAASRLLQANVELIFFDSTRRVSVFRAHRADPKPVVNVRSRGDVSGSPSVPGPVGSLVLGLATAFGLQQQHAHVANLYVTVKDNDVTLVATVLPFLIPLCLAFAIAVVCGTLLAGALTRQALRPLDDVTAALQRFAAGDLTPQPIAADENHELATLATAYNGAISQMERAFAARDRANAAMRQFIADAGHQLRTPLTVVQGFIAILRRGGFDSAADRERILDTMNGQSRIMAGLIDKLILLERWESLDAVPPAEPIDVGTLVADLVAPIADAHPDRSFTISAEGGMMAAIDPTELGYIVTNLVDNAVKYGLGEIAVHVHPERGAVAVEVADEGPGIAPEDSARVFDRFYRGAQRDVGGSGLGLAIAKRAVERAYGTITLDSGPQGSRFTVRLPRTGTPVQ